MSVELQDFRGKLTHEAHCAIKAYGIANDMEVQEVVRMVMHAWALKQIHGATVMQRCLKAKGMSGESRGAPGSGPDGLSWDDAK